MKKQIVLITGTSRGLGKSLAETLNPDTYFIYSGVRNEAEAPEGTTPIKLDLRVEESLENCVNTIIREKGTIDILIHNAGIAYWGGADTLSSEEAKELFQVNFFAPCRLTQLFLPYMRKKRSGKIVFISSIRATESSAFMGMYSASKAALEAVAFDWAVTLAKWNISVLVIQPGPMATGIDIKHGSYFPSDQDNPYFPYGEVSLKWQPVQEVAKVVVEKLQDPHPPFRSQTNESSISTIAKHLKDPSGMKWYQEQKNWVS